MKKNRPHRAKKHQKKSLKKVKQKIPLLIQVEGATLDEFSYNLNKYSQKGYKLVESSIHHHFDSYFQNHSCLVYKPTGGKK